MAVMKDYYCTKCDRLIEDQFEVPKCCSKSMRVALTRVNTPEWGSPRQYIHLRDEPFSSRGELERYKRDNNLTLAPSADKHGGARNEDHLNLGKKFSYAGQKARG